MTRHNFGLVATSSRACDSNCAALPTMPRAETPASVPLAHTPALLESALASCLQKRPVPASAMADVRARKLVPFFPVGQAHTGTVNKADNIRARYGPLGLRRVKSPC